MKAGSPGFERPVRQAAPCGRLVPWLGARPAQRYRAYMRNGPTPRGGDGKRAPEPLDARQSSRLSVYMIIVTLLDQAFRVPGTRWRFGLDALIGLVPGAGDVATAVVGAYGLFVANQLGAPASIQLRMLMNLAVDAVFGAIPLLGDVFDFAFKSHTRNAKLLQGWLATPHAKRRSSSLLLVVILVGFFALIVCTVWLAIAGARALFHLVAH